MIPFDIRMANFLGSTAFIADKKLQHAMWAERNKKISSIISLGELYAQFFDDNDIDNFIIDELDKSLLTKEQKEAIKVIRDDLNNFTKAPNRKTYQASDAELIDDPEWGQIVLLAQSTLNIFEKDKNTQLFRP